MSSFSMTKLVRDCVYVLLYYDEIRGLNFNPPNYRLYINAMVGQHLNKEFTKLQLLEYCNCSLLIFLCYYIINCMSLEEYVNAQRF